MVINLSDLKISRQKNLTALRTYLNRVCSVNKSFDESQMVQVFCNDKKEFLAFESVEFNISFTAQGHKVSEIIKSPFVVPRVPFYAFRDWVCSCR